MKFTLNFNMDNDVFDVSPEHEIKRVFDEVVYHLDHGKTEAGMYDYNGNRIGFWEIID